MVIAGTIFGVSFAGIIAVIVNKLAHMHRGQHIVSISADLDRKIKKISEDIFVALKRSPKVVGHTIAYLTIKVSVVIIEKTKKKIYPKVAHLVDAVKGKNIPKNGGSASFFLTNIKEHKDSLKH